MTFLSPYVYQNLNQQATDMSNSHHKAKLKYSYNLDNEEAKTVLHRHSYILNCISSFIYRASQKRQKFMKEKQDKDNRQNTIIINFAQINDLIR